MAGVVRIGFYVKEFGKILAYFAAVLGVGALLAPPLYGLGQALVAAGHGDFLAKYGFQKYFNRALLLASLALLPVWILWLRVGVGELSWLRADPIWLRRLGVGFGLGALALGVLAGIYLGLGIWEFKLPIPWGALGRALLSAGVVAALEELLFRGGLQTVIARSMGPRGAVWATSALFSVVHFLKPNPALRLETVGWSSGFELIPEAFHQFSDPALVLGGWVTLCVFGWVLGMAVERTGSLWMSVGLHAGVVWVKLSFEKAAICKGSFLPWVGSQLPVGLVPVAVLLLLGMVVVRWESLGGVREEGR